MGSRWTWCPRRRCADARAFGGPPHDFVVGEGGDDAVAADHGAAAVAAAADSAVEICLPCSLAYIFDGQTRRSSSCVGSAGDFDRTYRKGYEMLVRQVNAKGMGSRSCRVLVSYS